jgi:hypothetical protein
MSPPRHAHGRRRHRLSLHTPFFRCTYMHKVTRGRMLGFCSNSIWFVMPWWATLRCIYFCLGCILSSLFFSLSIVQGTETNRPLLKLETDMSIWLYTSKLHS